MRVPELPGLTRQSAQAFTSRRPSVEAKGPDAHDGDLSGFSLAHMRFRSAQIAPSAKGFALRTHDIEIVADIGFERSHGRSVGVWVPDIDENE